MDELAAKRAERSNDCRLWSAEDCLEDALKEVKGKKVHMAIHWFEIDEDGGRVHHFAASNVTYPEHIALLNIALRDCIDNWIAE